MLRDNTPGHNEAIADMSQYSIESGRNSIQKQYENMVSERKILVERKLELEQSLSLNKPTLRTGPAGLLVTRKRVIEEITEIQQRLICIKPIMGKLHAKLEKNARSSVAVLEDILTVLKLILKEKAK